MSNTVNHKKYRDIEYFKDDMIYDFTPGDDIVIQEKIDGSNASFIYDEVCDGIIAFSRNYVLDSENTLRGFWNWTQQLDKALIKNVLGTRLKVFGEWLTKHTVAYPAERYNHFYCFDVWDTENNSWLSQNESMEIAKKLGLTYVPVFYTGKFTRWSDVKCYIGRTDLGGEEGEGIVVKNMTNFNYTKLVSEKFLETHAPKRRQAGEKQHEVQTQLSENMKLAQAVVTRARIEKILHKMVDDGLIPENWGRNEMSVIMQNLGKLVYDDCIKEEPESVGRIEGFGKAANKIIGSELKNIMLDRIK